jgi:hypothetical protein
MGKFAKLLFQCNKLHNFYAIDRIVCCIGIAVGRLGQTIRKDFVIKGPFAAIFPFKIKNELLPKRPFNPIFSAYLSYYSENYLLIYIPLSDILPHR